jgi:hypothetical protein
LFVSQTLSCPERRRLASIREYFFAFFQYLKSIIRTLPLRCLSMELFFSQMWRCAENLNGPVTSQVFSRLNSNRFTVCSHNLLTSDIQSKKRFFSFLFQPNSFFFLISTIRSPSFHSYFCSPTSPFFLTIGSEVFTYARKTCYAEPIR